MDLDADLCTVRFAHTLTCNRVVSSPCMTLRGKTYKRRQCIELMTLHTLRKFRLRPATRNLPQLPQTQTRSHFQDFNMVVIVQCRRQQRHFVGQVVIHRCIMKDATIISDRRYRAPVVFGNAGQRLFTNIIRIKPSAPTCIPLFSRMRP